MNNFAPQSRFCWVNPASGVREWIIQSWVFIKLGHCLAIKGLSFSSIIYHLLQFGNVEHVECERKIKPSHRNHLSELNINLKEVLIYFNIFLAITLLELEKWFLSWHGGNISWSWMLASLVVLNDSLDWWSWSWLWSMSMILIGGLDLWYQSAWLSGGCHCICK